MNNKIKKLVFMLLLVVFLIPTDNVYAGMSVSTKNSDAPPCEGLDWCYQNFAVRFSLYKYNGGVLTFYNSIDYDSYYSEVVGRTSILKEKTMLSYNSTGWKNTFGDEVNVIGKVMYTKGDKNGKRSVSWGSSYYSLGNIIQSTIPTIGGKFPTILDCKDKTNQKCNYDERFVKKIKQAFAIDNTSSSGTTVADRINNFFKLGTLAKTPNVTESDLQYLYVTVEPTYVFFNADTDYYYGTIYEILNLNYSGGSSNMVFKSTNAAAGEYFRGLSGQFYYDFMLNITSSTPTKTDVNNFVSKRDSAVIKVLDNYSLPHSSEDDLIYRECTKDTPDYVTCVTGSNANRTANRTQYGTGSNSNRGYGIGVFWMGDYVTSCSTTCSGKSNLELLKCAEKYCEKSSTTSNEKEGCITKCGYTKPAAFDCDASCSGSAKSKKCSPLSEQTNDKYCKRLADGYYKAVCTESTKVSYNNSLPTVFGFGMGGLNYTIGVSGTLDCDIVFNSDLYTFKYAALKKADRTGKSEPEQALASYININKEKKDISSIDYISTLDKVTLKIGSESLAMDKKKEYTSKASITTGASKTGVSSYTYYKVSDGSATSGSVANTKYSTKGDSVYELHRYCLSLKLGEIKPECSTSELKNHEQYYGYYNLYKEVTEVAVVATVKKDTSCINETNSCSFRVDDNPEDTSCSVLGNKLYITNINAKDLHYKLKATESWRNISEYATHRTVTGEAQIRYRTASGVLITQTCPKKETCKSLFKGNEYDSIRDYCNRKYLDDGYSSSTSCFKTCANSCKATVKCSNKTAVESWCRSNKKLYGDDDYALNRCINDCSCAGSTQYIYRPISTDDPFPGKDRKPGSNWVGFEEIAKTNALSNENALYVIKLTSKNIEEIRKDTATKGKYVYKDFSYYNKVEVSSSKKGLNLKSRYISDYPSIFTCVNGSGSCKRLGGV